MMIDINKEIRDLVEYGIDKNFLEERDRVYGINRILEVLDLKEYIEPEKYKYTQKDIEDILDNFRKWAVKNNRVENDSVNTLDLFDTRLISSLVKRPSEIEKEFWNNYDISPKRATDFYYQLSIDTNYIRKKRVSRDIKWVYNSEYGDLDITINMSKPEKDPRDIEKMKNEKSSSYPKCLLCKENESYRGGGSHPARGNHRIIELELNHEKWFLQYSPYTYYNEHCIVFEGEHEPMKVDINTFKRLLDFVEIFPHYFIGSNAGLPIVGGSILSHDHFQGGRYSFAMENAEEKDHLELDGIYTSTLKWPMSVIRLKSEDKEKLIQRAFKISKAWEDYNDESVGIISHTDDTPHNAITPISRKREGLYEIDLVLRNNRTTEKRPYGLFHPREEYHNIKKENIGLIEVMGLAVLPSRLKREMEELKKYLLKDDLDSIKEDENLNKHLNFAKDIVKEEKLNKDNIDSIVEEKVGRVFLNVLKDAGVFKDTKEGRDAFNRCRKQLLS